MNHVDNEAPTAGGAPTRDQRLGLVRAFQAQAMLRRDPLAANLVRLTGRPEFRLQAALGQGPTSPEAHKRFVHDAEMYLKFVRQIDRLAQIERQLSPPTRGEGQSG